MDNFVHHQALAEEVNRLREDFASSEKTRKAVRKKLESSDNDLKTLKVGGCFRCISFTFIILCV